MGFCLVWGGDHLESELISREGADLCLTFIGRGVPLFVAPFLSLEGGGPRSTEE